MDFSLSEEQILLRDSGDRFIREQYDLESRRRLIASGEGFSPHNWRKFADLGWLSLLLPEDVGGLGSSFEDLAVLMIALGRGCILEPYVTTAVLCARLIDRSDRRADLLPQIGAGMLRLSLAHSEVQDRYSLQGARGVSALRDSSGYRLSGRKVMVLGATSADCLIVSATIEGEDDYALFLVDPRSHGVALSGYALIDGTSAADLTLECAAAETLFIASGDAADVLEEAVDRATLAYLAQAVGSMEACLDLCADYIKTRHQFGQPIGRFQALQHIMAEMFVETQEARSILYQGLAHIDGTSKARRKAVSAAKIVVSEAGQIVSGSGIQLHGGYGITDEYAISHHFRRLLVIEKLFGDIDYHMARYGRLASQ